MLYDCPHLDLSTDQVVLRNMIKVISKTDLIVCDMCEEILSVCTWYNDTEDSEIQDNL